MNTTSIDKNVFHAINLQDRAAACYELAQEKLAEGLIDDAIYYQHLQRYVSKLARVLLGIEDGSRRPR